MSWQRHLSRASFDNDYTTIYALSSAPGKAGIAVIRVSGPACLDVYKALCPAAANLKPRYAAVRTLYDPDKAEAGNADVLDSAALVLYFPGPKTVTGEDVLELHVHGGLATVRAVLSAIPRAVKRERDQQGLHTVRYAEPGEFTRRAFLNDRLDLAQVEALGAALDAETEQQRRAAVVGTGQDRQLGRTYDGWRMMLLKARAELEALIDFAEDQHFDESPTELLISVSVQVHALLRAMAVHESAAIRGSLLRQGIRLALVGPANTGKSSLMNLIVGREASIVSHEAGTTRDVVEASLDIRGYLCTFADTAGFRGEARGARNAIEAEGIRRARQKAVDADVVIVLASVNQPPPGHVPCGINYDAETLRLAAQAQKCVVVLNKCDLVQDARRQTDLRASLRDAVRSFKDEDDMPPLVTISCQQAESAAASQTTINEVEDASDPGGIHNLVDTLVRIFASMTDLPPDAQHLLGVTVRQKQLLTQCRHHLEGFLASASSHHPDIVLAAEHLRYAANCLARITGRGEVGDIEEVLGVIFEKFCVGK